MTNITERAVAAINLALESIEAKLQRHPGDLGLEKAKASLESTKADLQGTTPASERSSKA